MKLSPIPDLASRLQLAATTVVVSALVAFSQVVFHGRLVTITLGDTDDAMRLVLVRALVGGGGWFDQHFTRLQPPLGTYMHWSRLVDGGEAVLLRLFALALPAAQAETAMRIAWPLLWIVPTVAAVLLVARRLGGGRAVFLGAISAVISVSMSGQFFPGRIDHHNVQIACCLMAFAAAVQRPTWRWGLACGLVSALGLAVGLEALPFLALTGAALGLGWAFGRLPAPQIVAYGAALALGACGLHLLQTPPDRWTVTACDALAFNLVAGLLTAGLGLAAAAAAARRAGWPLRLGALAMVGLAAGGAYLVLEPLCVHGPMAAIDPELKRVWLAYVVELTPWPLYLAKSPAGAIMMAAPVILGLVGWLWLGRRSEQRADFTWRLAGALVIASGLMGFAAIRSMEYAVWFFAPVAGAALADSAAVFLRNRMLPAVLAMFAANLAPAWAVAAAQSWSSGHSAPTRLLSPSGADRCTETAAYAPLARLSPGLVLSEIDAGPYILATSRDSVLAAPYHRLTWGIKQERRLLGAPPEQAQAGLRALHVAYVLDCPAHARNPDHAGLPAGSLQRLLDQGRAPSWLQPLSRPGEPLQLYRVRTAPASTL